MFDRDEMHAYSNFDSQFLANLADDTFSYRFTGFDLPARKFPQSPHRAASFPLIDEDLAVAIPDYSNTDLFVGEGGSQNWGRRLASDRS